MVLYVATKNQGKIKEINKRKSKKGKVIEKGIIKKAGKRKI